MLKKNLLQKFIREYQGIIYLAIIIISIVLFLVFQLRDHTGLQPVYHILGIRISLYGCMIAMGILICMVYYEILKPKALDTLNVIEATVWLLIPALVFARGWHVVTDFDLYQGNLKMIFDFSSGGLSIFGGILGGLLGGVIFAYSHGFDINLGVNLLTVVLPLGQMVGRLGNLVNQELFGPPTDKPWGMYVLPENRPAQYINQQYFHSAFLYEMFGSFLLFFALYVLYRYLINRKSKLLESSFVIGAVYLMGYGIIRFIVEFYRLEKAWHLGINVNQFIATIMIVIGFVYLVTFYLKDRYESKN